MKDRWLPHIQQFRACVDVVSAPSGGNCIAYTSASADRYVRVDASIAATAQLHIHLMLPLSFPVSRRLTVARACAVTALCMVPVSTALTNVFCALFAVALIASPSFGAISGCQ